MNRSFNYIAITNNPEEARILSECGVQQIMIDTEVLGKRERQGHKDTIISDHVLSDVQILKSLNLQSEIICRINPYHKSISKEIDTAISYGADVIMVPMITCIEEYKTIVDCINSRAKVLPLIETPYSFFKLTHICEYTALRQIHFGLNDLCISLQMNNLFEILLSTSFQCIVENLNLSLKGIGGIGDPQVPQKVDPILLLNHYLKLGANSVILSRNFFENNFNKSYILNSLTLLENAVTKGYDSSLDSTLKSQINKM